MAAVRSLFPFLFGGTFIEGPQQNPTPEPISPVFPFLFGGTFIEGPSAAPLKSPIFISLPFRRDFH